MSDGIDLTQDEAETVHWMENYVNIRGKKLSREKKEQVWSLIDKLEDELDT